MNIFCYELSGILVLFRQKLLLRFLSRWKKLEQQYPYNFYHDKKNSDAIDNIDKFVESLMISSSRPMLHGDYSPILDYVIRTMYFV